MTAATDMDDGLASLLKQRAQTSPDGLFAHHQGEPISFGLLDRRSDTIARNLRRAGLKRGAKVAVVMRNSPLALAVLFAFAKAGVVWIPINAAARGDSLSYILSHSEPDGVIADADALQRIADCGVLGEGVHVWSTSDDNAASIDALVDGDQEFDEACPAADEPYAIMYTSGTTGPPKGVMVSHRMLRLSGEAIAIVSAAQPGDIFHMWEPLYHIGGAQMMMMPLIRDVHLVMVERFSASTFWEQVQQFKASHIHFLGGILQILLKQPEGPFDRSHGARIAFGGGCPADLWRPFEERFGVKIRECYGMTECCSVTTFNDGGPAGSVGRALPWFSVDLLDAAGNPVATGDKGEIVVRANPPGTLTKGYYKNPEATRNTLRNGALHTGDIGSFDRDGNLYFHGRRTDNVRVRGENVSAWEVEHVAAGHAAVEDCAMIGIAADVGEQEIKLFVKLNAGASIAAWELSHWLGARLAPYQNPRYIKIVEEFERTPSLRIMKHKLPARTDDAWDRAVSIRKAE